MRKRNRHQNNKPQSVNKEKTDVLRTLASAMLTRQQFAQSLGFQFNGQRSLYEVLGYKTDLTFEDYYGAYDRGDIAQRIVEAHPVSTWRRKPVISNDDDPSTFTDFEIAWTKLAVSRKVFHYLERADKLAGIGEYGCLLIGTTDVRKQDDMARPMARLKGPEDVIYLMPLTQEFAEISTIDNDPSSSRYGLPETYIVSVVETSTALGSPTMLGNNAKISVHWSRIIHIAEGLRENDIYGTPRLKHVMNRLFDVDKIAGGSAETFWQAAKRIMVLQAKEGYSAVDSDDALTEMMDELVHGLRRVIDLQGYEAKVLETSDVKPREAFEVQLALISSATGIPQRILLGSEQGKMASTQDEVNWNGRIADRQINFAEPTVLRPFVDRLITAGALPVPDNEYTVTWPSLFELSDKEKAQIGLLKARSIAVLVGTNGGNFEFFQKISPIEEVRSELLNLRSMKIENAARKGGGQVDAPAVPAKGDTGATA